MNLLPVLPGETPHWRSEITGVALASALLLVACGASLPASAADPIPSKSTYSKAYGETKGVVTVDTAKELPRYPAVESKDAIATWKVKQGFKLQLAAHEPQVRDPIAVSFDEQGRMFVVEMIDYSEMRDVTPHLGRVSMLEDKDGDGYYETSHIFADNLPWPTGVICANGGIYVIATPDVYFFKDTKGTGNADVREVVFTGFGTGVKLLNVQALANCPQWGLDNRIHIQAGGGNRGKVKCLKRPDLPEIELGGRDFWFDPRTYEFGLEAGGAQFGMSFDNYGRKFACSNSDHLQYFVYDDRYAARNPYFSMPPARQSIAADGGAAEVFRISPDEPWRIIRTRWRVAGVVKGSVEGGGRVSGYFTGATGTTVYRGDAYGPDFVNNTFTGDAGGQLVHRKKIHPEGVGLVGRRPDDEQNAEFAASTDTWVRVVNFANAPDGCLHVIDMYREVIEHPWSIPEEIKQHLDLNSGNERGRIYRIVPDKSHWQRRVDVTLGKADTRGLVGVLSHPNGWHRDTASRLLHERQDQATVPMLESVIDEASEPLARLHALSALDGLGALRETAVIKTLTDPDEHLRERGLLMLEKIASNEQRLSSDATQKLLGLLRDPSERVRFQLALTAGNFPVEARPTAVQILSSLFTSHLPASGSGPATAPSRELAAAIASAPANMASEVLLAANKSTHATFAPIADAMAPLLRTVAAQGNRTEITKALMSLSEQGRPFRPNGLRSLLEGLKQSRLSVAEVDPSGKVEAFVSSATTLARDSTANTAARLEAIEILGLVPSKEATDALKLCLAQGQPDSIQTAALTTLARSSSADVATAMLDHWPHYGAKAREAALVALIAREDRATALLAAIQSGVIKATELTASQVQSLVQHKNVNLAARAKSTLAAVIPPSREEVVAKFKPALTLRGDAARGQTHYIARCMACHRAGTQGMQVGPDLTTVKTKGRDGILTGILEPNKEVAPQYLAYTLNTKDGLTMFGAITKDDASGVTLRMMGGAEVTVQRSQIKGSSSSGQSLMPEGLEAGLDVQGMADLLTFIEEVK